MQFEKKIIKYGKEKIIMSKTYIHYGNDEYKPELVTRVTPRGEYYLECKPPIGLWASPEECDLPWKTWCEGEEYKLERLEESFKFTIKDDAKILNVHSLSDIEKYNKWILNVPMCEFKYIFDKPFRVLTCFNEIMDVYDGMELFYSENIEQFRFSDTFTTWDCDSIVIWNPEIIIPEPRKKEE